jgi:MarR family transcriptional regulator, organic hydroperoxide resistance regulator
MTRTATATPSREDVLTRLGAAFKALMAAQRRLRGRETHRAGELSIAQYHLLFGLSETVELSSSQLAQVADLAPATVTQMLDGLEAMGLVERRRSERDRRVVTCSLTDGGRELITRKRAHWEGRWREALSDFRSDELETAARVLDRLRGMYEQFDAES